MQNIYKLLRARNSKCRHKRNPAPIKSFLHTFTKQLLCNLSRRMVAISVSALNQQIIYLANAQTTPCFTETSSKPKAHSTRFPQLETLTDLIVKNGDIAREQTFHSPAINL